MRMSSLSCIEGLYITLRRSNASLSRNGSNSKLLQRLALPLPTFGDFLESLINQKEMISSDVKFLPTYIGSYMNEYQKSIADMAEASLRCVAFAYCPYDLEKVPKGEQLSNWDLPEDDLILLGIVGIKDPCRPGVKDAVKLCTTAGVKVRMVTGDNIQTAKAIALECGILDSGVAVTETTVIEGRVFRALSEGAREAIAENITVMGRSSPNDKLLLVQALKKKGHVVAVTGDGTNDARGFVKEESFWTEFFQGVESTQKMMQKLSWCKY